MPITSTSRNSPVKECRCQRTQQCHRESIPLNRDHSHAMRLLFNTCALAIGYLSRCRQAQALSSVNPGDIQGVEVQRSKLVNNPHSPYCFVASSITSLDPSSNFLATQVWPSARFASFEVKNHVIPGWTVCEFGCGPGMPSLTAASCGCSVLATDLDEFALELVRKAAEEQNLNVNTCRFDLIADSEDEEKRAILAIHERLGAKVDLVIFSDVFENFDVATGTAQLTKYFLDQGSRVWTFAQSDRAQRDGYIRKLNELLGLKGSDALSFTDAPYNVKEYLWLCDLDETKVVYG